MMEKEVKKTNGINVGAGSSGTRKKNLLTLREKLEMLNKMDNGVSVSSLQKEYGVGKSTIYDIKSQRGRILNFIDELHTTTGISTRKTLRGPTNSILDKLLFDWFRENINNGVSVTGPMIIERAKAIHDDLKINGDCDFSSGWLYRFKNRHGIKYLNVSGEQVVMDPEPIEDLISKNKIMQSSLIKQDPSCNSDFDPSYNNDFDPSSNSDFDPSRNNNFDPSRNCNFDPSRNSDFEPSCNVSECDPLIIEVDAKPLQLLQTIKCEPENTELLSNSEPEVSVSEAVSCCERLLEFMERWPSATDKEILQIYRLKDKLKKHERGNQKKKNTTFSSSS